MTRIGAVLVVVALLGCDSTSPVVVASITAVRPDSVLFHGQKVSTKAALSSLFNVTAEGGARVEDPRIIEFTIDGPGWNILADSIVAPQSDSWATLHASANGHTASVNLGSVIDLRSREWEFHSFCRCTGGLPCFVTGSGPTPDSLVTRGTFTQFIYNVIQVTFGPSTGQHAAVQGYPTGGTVTDTLWQHGGIGSPPEVVSVDTDGLFPISVRPDSLVVFMGADRLQRAVMTLTQANPPIYHTNAAQGCADVGDRGPTLRAK